MSQVNFVCQCQSGCEDSPIYDYVRIADPEEDISLMNEAYEIVIPDDEIKIEYTHPLTSPMTFTHQKKDGFTRADLVRQVSEDYKRIYQQSPQKITGEGYPSKLDYLVLNSLQREGDCYKADVDA